MSDHCIYCNRLITGMGFIGSVCDRCQPVVDLLDTFLHTNAAELFVVQALCKVGHYEVRKKEDGWK